MKAVIRLLILAMACALFCSQGIAISEEATMPPLRHILAISLTVTPDEMVTPGETTINFTITNSSQYTASNLYYTSSDGLHSETLGQVAPGETQVFSRAYTVSQEELDAGLCRFTVSHDDIPAGDSPVNYTVEAAVTKTEAAPNIEFTRQVSSRSVRPGSAALLIYRVRNTGNVPLTQIRVTDELADFSGRVEELQPGAYKVFSSRVTLSADAVSRPEVTYVAEDVSEDALTVALSDLSISVSDPALSVALVLDKVTGLSGDTVNGVITIAAIGSDFRDISVTDSVNGTLLADALVIKAGQSVTLTCSWPLRKPSEFQVSAEGISDTGEAVSASSGVTKVSLTGEFSESSLAVTATARTPVINHSGTVRVTVAIVNSGNCVARDVTLSEATLGDIRTFDFIPVGDPTYREVLVDVREDSNLVFAIRYEAGGAEIVSESQPVNVTIDSSGVNPESASQQEETGVKAWIIRNFDNQTTYIWMISIAGAVLVALITVLIVSHYHERRQRKVRERRRRARGKQFPKRGGNDV